MANMRGFVEQLKEKYPGPGWDDNLDTPPPPVRRPKKASSPLVAPQGKVRGAGSVGLRWAVHLAALNDGSLRPSTIRWFELFLWEYSPGRVWYGNVVDLGKQVGIARAASFAAVKELLAGHYLAKVKNGYLCIPVEQDIDSGLLPLEQMKLPTLDSAPASAKKFLRQKGRA